VILVVGLDAHAWTGANSALRYMAGDLGLSVEGVSRLQIGYLAAYGLGLLLSGCLSRLLGEKSCYLGGLALFTLASGLCGLASGPVWLGACWTVQGLSAGVLFAATLALLLETFPRRRWGLVFAVLATALTVAAAAGARFGTRLAENHSWRWIFFFNVPAGCLLFPVVAVLLLVVDPRRQTPPRTEPRAPWGSDLVGLLRERSFLCGAVLLSFVALCHAGAAELVRPSPALAGPAGPGQALMPAGGGLISLVLMFGAAYLLGTRADARWALLPALVLLAASYCWMAARAGEVRAGMVVGPWGLNRVAVPVLFVLLNVLALRDLPGERLGNAVGLLIALTYVAGSLGAVLATGLLARETQSPLPDLNGLPATGELGTEVRLAFEEAYQQAHPGPGTIACLWGFGILTLALAPLGLLLKPTAAGGANGPEAPARGTDVPR
jgi:MFS family permease